MRILIGYSACPLTRAAFERHGHTVITCDLLPSRDGAGNHYQGDIWDIAREPWDMAIFHPMCTYLTVSAAWAFGDGPYHQKVKPGTLVGAARRDARDEAIENFRRLLALPYPKAIENPAPSFVSKAIRPPDQTIQPYEFGDDASKRTGLWLDRLPPLVPTARVRGRIVNGVERFANQTDSGQNRLSPSDDRWLERSKTYPGIVAAMGDQWGNETAIERDLFAFTEYGGAVSEYPEHDRAARFKCERGCGTFQRHKCGVFRGRLHCPICRYVGTLRYQSDEAH